MDDRTRERKRDSTQQTLKFFETLLRVSTDGIVITDSNQNILVVNDAFCDIFGKRSQDIIQSNLYIWLEYLDSGAKPQWIELENCVRLKNVCTNNEFQMTTKNGVRYFNVNATQLERRADKDNGVIITVWHDITSLKEAEAVLMESEHVLNEAQRIADTGSWQINIHEETEYLSPTMCDIYGIKKSIISIEEGMSMVHPDDRIKAEEAFEKALNGVPPALEYRIVRPNGNVRFVFTPGSRVLYDDEGNPTKIIGVTQDITKRKHAEFERERLFQEMRERVKELTCMYEVSKSIRMRKTPEEVFNDVVRLIHNSCHYPEITACKVVFEGEEFVAAPFRETKWKLSSDIIVEGERCGSVEVFYLEERPAKDEGPFLKEERQLIDGLARSLSEMLDHRKAEEKAREHQAQLFHISRLHTLQQMTSELAHEIDQPLCAILTNTHACLRMMRTRPEVTDELIETLEEVVGQVERADVVMRRVRGFASKQDQRREPVEINQIIRDSLWLFKAETDRHNITVSLELSGDSHEDKMPLLVVADTILIEQVLVNLARNAIESLVEVDKSRRELTIQTNRIEHSRVEISIIDTGIGIPPELTDNIFDPFLSNKPGGLGIGLSLSRSIVESHNGQLLYKPNPGGGAIFHFTLPEV